MYDARVIASWFINRAKKDGESESSLTIMCLLKMAYIAHGWHLALESKPLFKNRIEAWMYGPVVPDIYYQFRDQGLRPQRLIKDFEKNEPTSDTVAFLEQIYDIYGDMPAWRLSNLTHVANGPWAITRKWGGWYSEIPDDLIKSHYINKLHEADSSNERSSSS